MRAVTRAFAVLNSVASSGRGRSLQDIANMIGLAKSTTFRIVGALESMGYLMRGEDLNYSLTPKFANLTASADRMRSAKQLLHPVLLSLVRTTGENVALHCVQDHERVCVDVARSHTPLIGMHRIGDKLPLGLGAASMILMAFMPAPELQRYLRPAAKAAACSLKDLRSILETTRQQGYAVSHGGGVKTLTGIAAPVFSFSGSVDYALAIVVPTTRVSGRVMKLIDAVTDAAQIASNRLAGMRVEIA